MHALSLLCTLPSRRCASFLQVGLERESSDLLQACDKLVDQLLPSNIVGHACAYPTEEILNFTIDRHLLIMNKSCPLLWYSIVGSLFFAFPFRGIQILAFVDYSMFSATSRAVAVLKLWRTSLPGDGGSLWVKLHRPRRMRREHHRRINRHA